MSTASAATKIIATSTATGAAGAAFKPLIEPIAKFGPVTLSPLEIVQIVSAAFLLLKPSKIASWVVALTISSDLIVNKVIQVVSAPSATPHDSPETVPVKDSTPAVDPREVAV